MRRRDDEANLHDMPIGRREGDTRDYGRSLVFLRFLGRNVLQPRHATPESPVRELSPQIDGRRRPR